MSKPVKEMITCELRSRYGELESALWVEMLGIDGITTNQFRGELRQRGMRLEVVKNSLFRRACADAPLARLAEALSGPAALLTGGDSLVDIAKLIDEWRPKMPSLRLRAAILEGEYLDETAVGGLSKMPTKADMQARLAATVLSPGANVVSAALSAGSNLAGCIEALIKKLEEGETAAAA